jgi:GWxTD domain-containing protein
MKRNLLGFRVGTIFLCLLLIWFASPRAEEPRKFRIGLDYASFWDFQDTSRSYVEMYYSYNRKELDFVPQEEALLATVLMQLSITDEQGNEVENRMWNTMSQVRDAEEAKTVDYMIIDRISVEIPPGNYQIKLKATDVNSMSEGGVTKDLQVREFAGQGLQLSDIQLAFSITPEATAGRFNKGGQRVLPNPSGVFTHAGGMVYFYAELYNLVDAANAKPEYELRFGLLDTDGKKVKDFGKQTKTKPGNSAVVMSGVNISTLTGGEYVLSLEAKDRETGKKAYATKNFVVLREPTEEELAAELVKRFKQDVTYIASPGELEMFDDLNFVGKRSFIDDFWRKKDTNPETPENEFKTEHYRRIQTANLRFSRTQEAGDGWNTDMGRVYITYGEANEIERHPSTQAAKPWERWNYHDLEGGAYFIFVDEDGYGVYRLVHSDKKGEVYYPRWEELIGEQPTIR